MHSSAGPVLVSWAIPKNLPLRKGKPHLAVHVEDHPFEYGSFSGTIPAGNYGAGEVRIFDRGTYELLEQAPGKLTFRLVGRRLQGVWHMNRTRRDEDKDEWLVFLSADEREQPESLPELTPMLATAAPHAFDDDDFVFEPKWDGVRALAVCEEETVLISRNRRDITRTYPELARVHERLVTTSAVVDGEIVALDGQRPSFERLQSRINLVNERDVARAAKAVPATLIVFDVLYLDGRRTTELPLHERKALLTDLVVPSERVMVSSPCVDGSGIALSEAARSSGLEGIVAKRRASPYRPGKRTREWLKIKVVHDADVVIGGWSRGEGARNDVFGALLVGAYEGDELRFAGAVGTGFDRKTLTQLMELLRACERDDPPFAGDLRELRSGSGRSLRNPAWVEPALVARVEFRELTSAGRLRAPAFKGLRTDKDPHDCLFADLVAVGGRSA